MRPVAAQTHDSRHDSFGLAFARQLTQHCCQLFVRVASGLEEVDSKGVALRERESALVDMEVEACLTATLTAVECDVLQEETHSEAAEGAHQATLQNLTRQLQEQQDQHAAAKTAHQNALQDLTRQLDDARSAAESSTHEKQVSKLAHVCHTHSFRF